MMKPVSHIISEWLHMIPFGPIDDPHIVHTRSAYGPLKICACVIRTWSKRSAKYRLMIQKSLECSV